MSTTTTDETVTTAADIRVGDEILTAADVYERVNYLSRHDGVTRYVTRTHRARRDDTAAVFVRRSVTR